MISNEHACKKKSRMHKFNDTPTRRQHASLQDMGQPSPNKSDLAQITVTGYSAFTRSKTNWTRCKLVNRDMLCDIVQGGASSSVHSDLYGKLPRARSTHRPIPCSSLIRHRYLCARSKTESVHLAEEPEGYKYVPHERPRASGGGTREQTML